MKSLTQDQIQELDRLTASALEDVQEAWKIAMRGLRIDSRQYRQLCRAGKELQNFHTAIKDMAEDRGIEAEPIKKICMFG